jgi:hypothetical protein
MRAKSIYEKFTEDDSDPIHDMGIGSKFVKIKNGDIVQLKKYISQDEFDSLFKCTFAGAQYEENICGIVKSVRIYENYRVYLKIAFFGDFEETSSFIYLINVEDYIYVEAKASIDTWEKYFRVIPKEEALKESLNEKFFEDSDPIEDLGIGIIAIREFETLKDAAKMFVENIKILTDGEFESKEHLKEVIIAIRRDKRQEGMPSLLKKCMHYLEGKIGKRKYVPLTIKELGPRFDKHASRLTFLKDFKIEVTNYALDSLPLMDLLKKESLNEKFSEDSDPINDLGIGIPYIWENLKPGDILLVKKHIRDNFPDKGDYLLITDVNKEYMDNYARIRYSLHSSYDDLIDYIKSPEKKRYLHNWELSYSFFKETFIYVNNKDELLKESVNEKFTEDSDPIHDMDIGLIKEIEYYLNNESGYSYSAKTYGPIDTKDYLWMCVASKKYNYVKYLIENGWDIHTEDDRPLRCAIAVNCPRLTNYLLSKGANAHAGNNWCFETAKQHGRYNVLKILKKYE